MKYQKQGEFYYGFADLSISEVYRYCPEFFDGMALLVTCLDSTAPASRHERWLRLLEEGRIEFKKCDNGVWFSGHDAQRILLAGQTFCRFDEVYLFGGERCPCIGRQKVFTTDGYNFGDAVPNEFADFFASSGARRYLSDGCGLNFVCESRLLLQALEAIDVR